MDNKIYDLTIIGSGPAGLAAAIYAQRARLDTIVIEKNYMSGGQVLNTYEVDNYPGLSGINGFDMGMKFREHAESLGAVFLQTEVSELIIGKDENIKRIMTSKGEIHSRTVMIATGARYRKLEVPGEEQLTGMGVSYCATCDGAFFREKEVLVVGGGDVAVEDAIFLARGCKKVYVVHRRDELRAAKSLQEKLFSLENVEMLWDTVVEEIQGKDQVKSVRLKNVKEGTERTQDIDGVFVAVGILPNSEIFEGKIAMDDHGYIVAGEECCTDIDGVFAGGDVRTKMLRQIITAAADGANAVTSVQNYLIAHN